MNIKKINKVWFFAVLGIILAVVVWVLSSNKTSEEVTFVYEKVATTNIQNTVTATGTVQPVDTVAIGTQVSGRIDKIYVDYNSQVKKGQVLAELDKKNLTSQLNSARANLQMARATLASSEATLVYERANYQRYASLHKKGLVSADEYEAARLAWLQAKQAVAANKETVAGAQENVKTAQTNLEYATITSPIDGIVTSKYVAEGQTVAASFSTPQLFGVARDLRDMQVLVDVDEADIADVTVGKQVRFTVDAYPDDTFVGTVKQVRLAATSKNNVVTYKVVVSTRNDDMKLKPGLTANVTIFTSQREGVLAVSNKALRFTPTKETVKNKKIKDVQAKSKVWVDEDGRVRAIPVSIGMTDGVHTEIVSGIKLGQRIITELKSVKGEDEEASNTQQESSPFQPKFGKKNNGNKK